ncbi:MAG: bifunctional phosphoribosylaminoimidazolecarboxamide formyltransferase/IMP cyclohydrolase [candidate division KSB1 bacterium]|nr:bifunctional phosphoribosylaminoimidazolecarboxamide formyltransferase/IMP cyclohydrolase [candidate division KSB1 bacterium]MDZ7334006.1 bifunctional phosphoribosylaminoimidazolecarboxamide formyltransferase/IMP cyclohydrolase [candidate division KSB1 bacterium]MDZ7357441.1 bifunctional phosphoribosylaminoimidazolecarboxamide formyltransferase/IMP cyclohydrolase [candidate division KSB1 bacterium]MDZ7399991.1 bifunctional phosphoribosylaminoimidazolecarboxamide formyltransferase/IMP cyclohyd
MSKIKQALISVHDKTGIVEFARSLQQMEIRIISTGGTAQLLQQNRISCQSVSAITGMPEMLDGRVKTLHPFIHGAILARRDNPDHLRQLHEQGISPIDMVVVNLYPFEQTIRQPNVTIDLAIENIDIGGPTMIRAAAKNYADVAVVTSPNQYASIIKELLDHRGELSLATRQRLAVQAFALTHQYDGAIARYLQNTIGSELYPARLTLNLAKISELRYGENPHQTAAFYRDLNATHPGITDLRQLHGKELSFNNIMDLDAVVKIVQSFDQPCAVIVKHHNPCGIGIGTQIFEAFEKALATDPVSAFGGIFGFNRAVDATTAAKLAEMFIEVVVAPEYDAEAFQILAKKKNVRLLKLKISSELTTEMDFKRVAGGVLVQSPDNKTIDDLELHVVTKRAPTELEWAGLKFAWKVVKWVKSNAVVFCLPDRTIGIGAGQMSRVDSSLLAVEKARRSGLSLQGTVVASDAFFPFRDGVDAAAEAGATAIIQPGGSVRDAEVIQAADEHRMAMVFTGVRHFRH